MDEQYMLGIDIGTSSCKTIILTTKGKVVGSAYHEYPTTYYSHYSWAEQNPEDWYSALRIATSKAIQEAKIFPEKVSAIGVTGQMSGLVCVDKHKNIVRPAIIWMDIRNVEEAKWLKQKAGQKITALTYNPITTAFILPKILWLKKYEPKNWGKIYKIQSPKDYIRLRLTDNWATDYNDASATLLFEVPKLRWSEEIAQITEISMEKLPPVKSSWEIVGYVTKQASAELGLKKGIPVVAGCGDMAAENLSAGGIHPFHRLIRLGTAGSISSPSNKPIRDPQEKCLCYAHCIPNMWLLESYVQAFGLSQKWFKDAFYRKQILKTELKNTGIYQLIDKEASEVELGAKWLFFHPFITGSPYWNPHLRGSFWGITPEHTRKHFARAVLEGTVYALRDAATILENLTGNKPQEWTLVGGGSKSKLWQQIVCDILGIDARILKTVDAALGAAMLGGIGTGIFQNTEEAIERCVKEQLKIRHQENNHRTYNSLYSVYKLIHQELIKKCSTIDQILEKVEEKPVLRKSTESYWNDR